ncbi:MAG TPA: hypothetical protein VEL76_37465 [Gemmataceae bacterium]|nr:hypothetical protein [Gemmataceae bacterium]
MPWQLPADHAEALQHPLRCFGDPELKRALVMSGPEGEPLALHGQSAEVYEARSQFSHQRWAVKCYREETPGLQQHSTALSDYLLKIDLPCLLMFQYLERGLCVRGRWFPIVKMHWDDGVPLNTFVSEAADRPASLHQLARLWLQLAADLRRLGIAHSALQHDHVLVTADTEGAPLSLRLIDYDAMYCPGRDGGQALETGHANYQHPQRLWQRTYDAQGDRFPLLLVYTALLAVAVGGRALWERYNTGDNLLFKESDFADPSTSAVFRELWRSSNRSVRALTGYLLLASQAKGDSVPLLDELAAEARTVVGGSAEEAPRFALKGNQKLLVEALLGGHAEGTTIVTKRSTQSNTEARKTFGVLVEDSEGAPGLAAALDDNFDLVVEDDPNAIPVVTPVAGPPPLPVVPALPAVPPPLPHDPTATTYHLEAWMPEQVAVMKVQGFVDAATGRVVVSEPGFMCIQLLDPYDLGRTPRPGLFGWLGFADPSAAPEPSILAIVDFHMAEKQTQFRKLLAITLRIRPGPDGLDPRSLRWRKSCDKLFCDIRAFLMGTQ